MSEPILIALVQLFALIPAALGMKKPGNARRILESYLSEHLRNQELEEYLLLFDELYEFHRENDGNTEHSTKNIQEICLRIQKQLSAKDRLLVFVKFLEFIAALSAGNEDTNQEIPSRFHPYFQIFKEVFSIRDTEYQAALSFVLADSLSAQDAVITISQEATGQKNRHILWGKLQGEIRILNLPSVGMLIGRYSGKDELYLNGHETGNRCFVLQPGAILKNSRTKPIYYTDILNCFHQGIENQAIEFTAHEIRYQFKNSSNGLYPFSFTARSGELIGVMGGSGVGKSTLLNVLNGNLSLNEGSIKINGYDLEKEKDKLEGVIGFVPQDDLLMEELTVFQNLYFSARLCFDSLDKHQIVRKVMHVLNDIGLMATRKLTVGDPLNKFISGGQRKRLNIALELIREPAILFADEPTSGLSSMDSEMVMLLLKEQTLRGKLVIVNIHQPSSDIYKLFDKLLILDKGGYPIYYGNPIDAITWFKSASNHVNPDESECLNCGYVNPELLLQITEARLVNEHGLQSGTRRKSPSDWYALFREKLQPSLEITETRQQIPHSSFKIPGWFRQFKIFSIRNLLAKLTNRQYLMINLLEGPLLASVLAFLTRFSFGDSYTFGGNRNMVPYLFMSVVVSLFLGMMVSAEEIIKDRRILKREAFLNLSRISYLNSKISFLFVLSAIQTFLYVITGNLILGIHDMTFSYWLILFSTAACANLIGLNISAGLNSVVAIYILIPFILVPQLLLSGTIVPFDHLNPAISSQRQVPLVGNLMTSRWTFEALAVEQFRNNRYECMFYETDKKISHHAYITSFVVPVLKAKIDESLFLARKGEDPEKLHKNLRILTSERIKLQQEAGFKIAALSGIEEYDFSEAEVKNAISALDSLSRYFAGKLNTYNAKRDRMYKKLENELGSEALKALKQSHYNENIAELVLNLNAGNMVVEGETELIRKKDPAFMDPVSRYGQAHFYAPVKFLGSIAIPTFWFNIGVIWLMSIVLYIALVADLLRKAIELSGKLKFR